MHVREVEGLEAGTMFLSTIYGCFGVDDEPTLLPLLESFLRNRSIGAHQVSAMVLWVFEAETLEDLEQMLLSAEKDRPS